MTGQFTLSKRALDLNDATSNSFTLSDVTEFESVVLKNSKYVVVLFTNIQPDGTGKKDIKGNKKETHWTLEQAESKLEYFKKQPGYEKGKVMHMFDITNTDYFCLDCDLVSASKCEDMVKSKVVYENSLSCAGTQKGLHMFYKKQECWDMTGVKTKQRVNKQWDIDFITSTGVLVDIDAAFDGGIYEWSMDDMSSVFDDGLPKGQQPQQTGQATSTKDTEYIRDEEHEIDLEKLSLHLNQVLDHDFGDWNVEFDDTKILLTHNSHTCLVDRNHTHTQPGHSMLYLNKAQYPVAACHSHGSTKLKIPAVELNRLKALLGVKSQKDIYNEEMKRHRDAVKEQDKDDQRAQIRKRMDEDGLLKECDAKIEFEKEVAYISSRASFITETTGPNGRTEMFWKNERQMKLHYANFYFQGWNERRGIPERQEYFPHWIGDLERRQYTHARIMPPGMDEPCPTDIFNLWTPMEMELVDEYEDDQLAWDDFKYLVWMLAGENEELCNYVLYWLAYTIKYPARKAGICLVFLGDEGCGKGTLMQFMEKIMGASKVFETDNPQETIWGTFNARLESSFLICLEEVQKKDMLDKHKLYDKITGLNANINIKGVESYQAKSYANYMVMTNDPDPIPVSSGQRRFVFCKTSQRKKVWGGTSENIDFWKNLQRHINNKNSVKTIYERLINLPDLTPNTFPDMPKPVTDYERDLQESNKPVQELFIEDLLCDRRFKDCSQVRMSRSNVYERFKAFSNKIGMDYTIKQAKLTLLLKNMELSWFVEGTIVKGTRAWAIDFERGRAENNIVLPDYECDADLDIIT
jgi:hypothetical protein